jgi:hypothetical protein
MQQSSPKLTDKSSAKEHRRKIMRELRDDKGFTFPEVRQVWRVKRYFPVFRFRTRPDTLIDFRGAK